MKPKAEKRPEAPLGSTYLVFDYIGQFGDGEADTPWPRMSPDPPIVPKPKGKRKARQRMKT